MAGLDPKVKNLIIFFITRGSACVGGLWLLITVTGVSNPFFLLGVIVFLVAIWRLALSIHRRLIQPAKHPLSYGKWAIVTGSTSGIGKAFAEHLAAQGVNLLVISRSVDKLESLCEELRAINRAITVRYIAYDFTKMGEEKDKFYESLAVACDEMDKDGGLGLLINNVGVANEIPKRLEEFTDKDIEDMINCNIFSTIWMTRTCTKVMRARGNGAVVSISSGSGNHPGPFLVVYSATKAFITQFSRSMHVESWGTGVDYLVVTPFYVVSNLYKRKSGTLIAPMPDKLVTGTFAQLGKKMIWQGHGYWFHGFIGNFSSYYWDAVHRYRKMMLDNRARYDARQAGKSGKSE